MIEIKGKYGEAKVFTDTLESSAEGLIKTFCDQPYSAQSKIRIMPDVHAGKGCTIGTTLTVKDAVVPNVVGVDIGCGMLTVKLREKRIDLPKLDSFIRQNIPCGRDVRETSHRSHGRLDVYELLCVKRVDIRRAKESLGTLGGGNHFIEADKDDNGNIYIANYNKNNILKVDKNGAITEILENIQSPYCMYITGDLLFISSQGSNSVLRYKLQ